MRGCEVAAIYAYGNYRRLVLVRSTLDTELIAGERIKNRRTWWSLPWRGWPCKQGKWMKKADKRQRHMWGQINLWPFFVEAAHCPVKPELSFSSRKFSPGLHFPAPSMSVWYHVTSCPCALVLASGMWENMWSWPICNSPFWMGDFFIVLPWPSSEALSQGWPVCFLSSGLTTSQLLPLLGTNIASPQYTCPNCPRARYQTTRHSPRALLN